MRSSRRRRTAWLAAGLAVLCLIAAAVLAFASLRSPFQGFQGGEVFVDVAKRTTTRDLAKQLAEAGVIQSPWQLLLAKILHPKAKLQAGEYRFAGASSALQVFSRIARGDIFFYEFTVPEGSNMFDIAAAISQLEFIHSDDFLLAAADSSSIRDIDPKAPSLEGYLFPSTYRLTRRTTAKQLCHMMTTQFRKQWHALGAKDVSVHDTVTLASLVEKEAGSAAERPTVASVFHNRLKKGMTLDCDPTTIYAAMLEKRFRGKIYRSDLQSENAYNTYRHAGLPPGPITNPGLASLKAALAPADTQYLYFVAKRDGSGSTFARTLQEHNRNVIAYRKGSK